MPLPASDEITQLTELTLWAVVALMALGAVLIWYRGRNTEGTYAEHTIVSVFIPAIAAAAYLTMATGYSVSIITLTDGGEQLVFWGRYIDWIVTTPLLLFDLALLAGADRNTIATLIGLDMYMIVTGLIASFAVDPTFRLVWWGVSTGAFLYILYIVFVDLPKFADANLGSDLMGTFNTLKNMLAVLWLAYPVVWLVGTEGLSVLGLGPETVLYGILDVLAKVGFGYILVNGIVTSAQTGAEAGAAAAAGDD
jgi:bacteriorhodopsin